MLDRYDKIIFEISRPGRTGYNLPDLDVDDLKLDSVIPNEYLNKEELDLPELSEVDVVRHYTNLSMKNYGLDTGMYPLGSCTMKYNPKINEEIVGLNGFKNLHPYQGDGCTQGALKLMYDLAESLAEISGMDAATLQPAAGAHGELTGVLLIRAYHEARGDMNRNKMIIPDSAHGTNPATCSMGGFTPIEIKSDENGLVDLEALEAAMTEEVAGLMLTNPNTLGLFDKNIEKIAEIVHKKGGLLYYDGANMNAVMGHSRPGDMGFDVVHFNTHKTFSTPHGGGGPGAGPVGCKKELIPYLPKPVIAKNGDKYFLDYNRPESIGKVKDFYGHFAILVRAYTYILTMGSDGLRKASTNAVLNANYLLSLLKENYNVPYDTICMHEFVLGGLKNADAGVTTLDVAKGLIDRGFHPPTVYFPLIVHEALMIEPTETESKETLDAYAAALNDIAKVAKENPEDLLNAPLTTKVCRPDETLAARKPVLVYTKEEEQ